MRRFMDNEQQDEATDRRKEQRWNIPVPVRVKGTRDDGTEFDEETITADVSPSGMCVLLTVPVQQGDRISITAPEEGFESWATVARVSPLGTGMHRVRVLFPQRTKFQRAAAKKKYVYDYTTENWVGYISEGMYYNSKHEPFGKIEDNQILSLVTGKVLFTVRADRVFDERGQCVGHII